MHCVVAVGSVECCKLLVEAEADLERMEPWNDPLIPLFLCDVWGQGLKVQVNNDIAVQHLHALKTDLSQQWFSHCFWDVCRDPCHLLMACWRVNPKDRSGAAPLHLACCFARARHLEIAQLLLDAKAKVGIEAVNFKINEGLLAEWHDFRWVKHYNSPMTYRSQRHINYNNYNYLWVLVYSN